MADVVDLSDNPLRSFTLIPDSRKASKTVFKFSQSRFPGVHVDTNFLQEDDNYTFLWKAGRQMVTHCNCDFEKFVNLNEHLNQLNVNFSEKKCETPDRLRGRPMKDISAEEMSCEDGCQNFNDCECSTREFDQSVILNCTKFDINNFTLLDSSSQPLSSKYNNLRLVLRNESELPIIPKNFKFKITEIVASGNKIQNVSIENLASDHLKILDLRDNRISTLSERVKEKFEGMTNLSLGGNPWICDCPIFQFLNDLDKNLNLTVATLIAQILADYLFRLKKMMFALTGFL